LPGRIEDVLLFGSRARGDAERGSDYDVAVLVRNLSDRPAAYRNVLFHPIGSAPRKHDRVVSAFGRLMRDGDASLRRAGRWLNATKDGRMVADYNEGFDPRADEVREAAVLAREFITVCRASFEIEPDEPSRE
jgi:hypothetical protein